MGMQYQGDWGIFISGWLIAALKATGWTIEQDFRHMDSVVGSYGASRNPAA
jgi:hypothetical protein